MTNDKLNLLLLATLCLTLCTVASAQYRPLHYPHSSQSPPGSVGRDMLTRGGPLRGYYQPVELVVPDGAKISVPKDGKFQRPRDTVTAGMLIGQVYRVKVTGIPRHEGEEVFPTIEVVNRLYPPAGQKVRFPIPIHITREELSLALNGQFVTRVVYLEDPNNALPAGEIEGFQRYFDIGNNLDPLRVADELGRPMAILRIGSRVPDEKTIQQFLYNSPPLAIYQTPWQEAKPAELKQIEGDGARIPPRRTNPPSDRTAKSITFEEIEEKKPQVAKRKPLPNFPRTMFRFTDVESKQKSQRIESDPVIPATATENPKRKLGTNEPPNTESNDFEIPTKQSIED